MQPLGCEISIRLLNESRAPIDKCLFGVGWADRKECAGTTHIFGWRVSDRE